MTRHIPNALTLMNLLCGAIAITFIFQNRLDVACYLILIGAGFDFLDGFTARLLNVSGELGKQLDSMADMVSFGAAPGFIAYKLLSYPYEGIAYRFEFLFFVPLLIIAFSGLRLAKFNIDKRQTTLFIGMPTPANALFWVGMAFIHLFVLEVEHGSFYDSSSYALVYEFAYVLLSQPSILILSLLLSYLLVANVRFLSLKFSGLEKIHWIYLSILALLGLVVVIISLICFSKHVLASLSIILFLYIICSVIYHFTNKRI